jgi:hypothetical protein
MGCAAKQGEPVGDRVSQRGVRSDHAEAAGAGAACEGAGMRLYVGRLNVRTF